MQPGEKPIDNSPGNQFDIRKAREDLRVEERLHRHQRFKRAARASPRSRFLRMSSVVIPSDSAWKFAKTR